MEDSTTIIQIKCSIVPDPPGSQRIRGCSPTASHRERDSTFTLCVTNCAGMYVWIKNVTLQQQQITGQTDEKANIWLRVASSAVWFTVAYYPLVVNSHT